MNKQDANINEIVKILKSTMGDLQERRKNTMGRRSEFALTLTNGYPPENKGISVVTLYGTGNKFIRSRKSNTISEGIGEILTKINRRMHHRVNLSKVPLNAFDSPMEKAVKIGAVMNKDDKKAVIGLHKGPTVDMIINTIGYGQPLTELRFSNVKKQFAEPKYYYDAVHFICDQEPIPQALKNLAQQVEVYVDEHR